MKSEICENEADSATGLSEVTTSDIQSCGDAKNEKILIKLDERHLWEKFRDFTNEMIVTKSGRRMFPVLKVSAANLDSSAMYSVQLDFQQVSGHRWKYVNGDWIPGSKAEQPAPQTTYLHPDSPNFGSHWMKDAINFSKVKLTNKHNGDGQVMLNSLHKYEPRVRIYKVGLNGDQKLISTKCFPEAQFVAVTAYQNEEITALKIKYNPFAKAFQDAKERPDQRDYFESVQENQQQKHVSPLPGPWFLPSPTSASLVPPPAHQFRNGFPSTNCDRLPDRFALRGHRAAPYPHALPRRSPPHGNLPREVGPNIPVLDIADSWHVSSPSHHVLTTGSSPAVMQNQYMWSMPSLSDQSCAMSHQLFVRPALTSDLPFTTTSAPIVSAHSMDPIYNQAFEGHSDISYSSVIAAAREGTSKSPWNVIPTTAI
ncbi:T-box transcription factor T homolog 1-like [Lineus longissimus]|uniref:T-box transcription factor T homolog 1-like n=1 Tax=Lineus longissimus TaxID=88925 RepID=UPI002B4ED888